MKIYEVDANVDYRTLFIENDEIWEEEMESCGVLNDIGIVTNKESISGKWKAPVVYYNELQDDVSNFRYAWGPSPLLFFDKTALEALDAYWKMSGEIVSATMETGEELFVFHTYNTIDVVDMDNCTFKDNCTELVKKYAFHKDKVKEFSYPLFRLPQWNSSSIYTVTGDMNYDLEEDFKTAYEKSGLTGLEFNEIWDSEAS